MRSSSSATIMIKPPAREYLGQAGRDVAQGQLGLAQNFEVRDQGLGHCTGVARDNDSFVKVFGKLSDDTTDISNVHPETRGQKPMQFTLSFQWQGGGAQWKLRTAKNSC
jgi:hypothetical protein